MKTNRRGRSGRGGAQPHGVPRRLLRLILWRPMMKKVRYGFWMPIFGGWLRNVEDEQMYATFEYNKRLAQRAEQIGFDITLLAELNLNDIKGATAPVLECWTTAAAVASGTEKVELINAIRPGFRLPA